MKKAFLTLVLGMFLFVSGSSFAQKVGYVDLNYLLNNSNIGKKYSSQLKPKAEQAEQKLRQIEAKLKKLGNQLNSSLLSEEAKKKKSKEFQRLLMERQKIYMEYQKIKSKTERELLLKIGKVIKEFAEKNNYDLILTGDFQNGVLYIGDSINITKQVLNYINKKLK